MLHTLYGQSVKVSVIVEHGGKWFSIDLRIARLQLLHRILLRRLNDGGRRMRGSRLYIHGGRHIA